MDRTALRAATGTERADLLDRLAGDAVDDRAALETLLWAVDDLDLARPAVRRLVIGEVDVDDVVQDVLITVADRLHTFRGDARFTTWLHQVARHKAIAHLRRRRDEAPLPDDGTETPGTDAARLSSMIATRASVRAALDDLPARYRDPVVLRDVDHLAYDRIAARLDLPAATVRTRVARGRALAAATLRRAQT